MVKEGGGARSVFSEGKKKRSTRFFFSKATPRRRRVLTAPIDLEICGEVPRIVSTMILQRNAKKKTICVCTIAGSNC